MVTVKSPSLQVARRPGPMSEKVKSRTSFGSRRRR